MNLRHLLPVFLLLAAANLLPAQPRDRRDERGNDRDRDRERSPRVIVYQHADYRGTFMVIYPGEAFENLGNLNFEGGGSLNDRISSIRIEGNAEVFVYENSRFRGAVMRLTENARDLSGRLMPDSMSASWNDRISALRVEARRRDARDEPRVDPEVMIKRAFLDVLMREAGPGDLRRYRGYVIDQGWTEPMVRDHLRHSDEFRREGADRVVRQAYLDVLGREPDPGGLKHFRELMLDRNWTEGDVRDDLRRSDEFRKKNSGREGERDGGREKPGNRR